MYGTIRRDRVEKLRLEGLVPVLASLVPSSDYSQIQKGTSDIRSTSIAIYLLRDTSSSDGGGRGKECNWYYDGACGGGGWDEGAFGVRTRPRIREREFIGFHGYSCHNGAIDTIEPLDMFSNTERDAPTVFRLSLLSGFRMGNLQVVMLCE